MLAKHCRPTRFRFEPLEPRLMMAITVNTLVDEFDGSIDDGDISLRDALAAAVQNETINFAVHGAMNLTLGELLINKSVTIDGPGPGKLTLAAHSEGSRLLRIDDGIDSNFIDVTIRGLTLTGGNTSGSGGAILNYENLTIDRCKILANSAAGDGGGIATLGRFSPDVNLPAGKLRLLNSTIDGNSARDGGGIHATGSEIAVENSTISRNTASHDGGGVFATNFTHLSLIGSTISGNSAASSAGGIVSSYNLSAAFCTITNNIADSDANGSGFGGGIVLSKSMGGAAVALLDHVIIAGNQDNSERAPDLEAINGAVRPFVSLHYCLIGNNTGSELTGAAVGNPDEKGNLIGDPEGAGIIDPRLGPLANNGGPAATHALLADSPAINTGDPAYIGRNLVLNGGFEAPLNTPAGGFVKYNGGQRFFGWQVGGHSVDIHHTGHTAAHSGTQSVDLSGMDAGSLTQLVTVTPGKQYLLDLWYTSHVFRPYAGDAKAEIRFGETLIDTLSSSKPPSTAQMNWKHAQYLVTANDAIEVLSFISQSPNGGIILDDIRLVELSDSVAQLPGTPTPEFDQRGAGFPKRVNGRTDMGAVEFQPLPPASAAPPTPPAPIVPFLLPINDEPDPAPLLLLDATPVAPPLVTLAYGSGGYVPAEKPSSATSIATEAFDAAFENDQANEMALLASFLDFVDPEAVNVEIGEEPPPQVVADNETPPGKSAIGILGENSVDEAAIHQRAVLMPGSALGSMSDESILLTAHTFVATHWRWFAGTSGVLLVCGAGYKGRNNWLQSARMRTR